MCSIYASAVRRMQPSAQLAVKMTGDVRRRVVREKYGRRGRSGDPEYRIKGLLVRNLEHLRLAQFAKIMDTWALTGTARRSWPPGSRRRNSATC
jgi:transposase